MPAPCGGHRHRLLKMKKALRRIFPFSITVILWYLSDPRFNPAGVLSIVPIFYYMFCQPVKRWFLFGFLMCLLLDFNAGSLFLFGSAFLLMNSLNVFFGILEKDGGAGFYARAFNVFLCMIAFFIFVHGIFNVHNFFGFFVRLAWVYLWLFLLYFPFVALFRWVSDDR
jgi:hypothetical protein